MAGGKGKKTHESPPKQLAMPADWRALGSLGQLLMTQRASEHRARMDSARKGK